jgi:DNA-binding GntR family transcriptional regulator
MPTADLQSACRHHRRIAEAIAAGDADAARMAMAAHIEEGRAGARTRAEEWRQANAGGVPEALRPFVR